MNIKNLFKKKSYANKKAELEIRESIYSEMNTLSDRQLEKWVSTKLELRELKVANLKIVKVSTLTPTSEDK